MRPKLELRTVSEALVAGAAVPEPTSAATTTRSTSTRRIPSSPFRLATRYTQLVPSWHKLRGHAAGAATYPRVMIRVCVAGVTGWTGRPVAEAVAAADDLELAG